MNAPQVPLRYARLWWLCGALLVITVVMLSLMPRPPQAGTGWDKTNHLLGYGALMWWFCQLDRRALRWALVFVLLGIAIEVLQPLTGRTFEPADMLANALGVALGWAVAMRGRPLAWFDGRLAYRR